MVLDRLCLRRTSAKSLCHISLVSRHQLCGQEDGNTHLLKQRLNVKPGGSQYDDRRSFRNVMYETLD